MFESPLVQFHGLPPRPVDSYQSPPPPIIRRRRHHQQRKSNKENQQQQTSLRRARGRRFSQSNNYILPLTDASNMVTLPYHLSSDLGYQLPQAKPSLCFFCPASDPQYSFYGPTSWTLPAPTKLPADAVNFNMDPAYLHNVQTLQTGPLPVSQFSHHQPIHDTFNDPEETYKTIDTPKMRRKLAVEGVRKAVSDAALRKMGIQVGGGFSSDHHHHALEQPINLNVVAEKQQDFIESLDKVEINPEKEEIVPHQNVAYSPRQYTPKPLLLPSILARGNRSPPPSSESIISPRRKISSARSRLSTLTCYHVERHAGPLSEDNSSVSATTEVDHNHEEGKLSQRCSTTTTDDVSTTPESSFANDSETPSRDSMMISEVDCGTTTPCETNFGEDHDGVNSEIMRPNISVETLKAEGVEFTSSAPEVDEKGQSRHSVLEALMWTIAAPRKIRTTEQRCQRSTLFTSDLSHRKSLGFWLGAAIPCHDASTKKHVGASSETTGLDHPLSSSSSDDPIRMKLLASDRNKNSIIHGGTLFFDLPDKPVAHPTFILPTTDTRKVVYSNLRNLAHSSSFFLWPPLFTKPSSFLRHS